MLNHKTDLVHSSSSDTSNAPQLPALTSLQWTTSRTLVSCNPPSTATKFWKHIYPPLDDGDTPKIEGDDMPLSIETWNDSTMHSRLHSSTEHKHANVLHHRSSQRWDLQRSLELRSSNCRRDEDYLSSNTRNQSRSRSLCRYLNPNANSLLEIPNQSP